jgi:Spy/CpxP family protein refolding chaperone
MMGGGWGRGGYGPGMMGGGPRGGFGPGMMGAGPRGGYGPGMGYGPRGGFGPGAQGGPAANADARLAFLKNELAITADQESAWQAFAKQTKQQAESMQALRAAAQAAAKTAPERLEQRAQFAKQRAANMEARSAALKDLYAALTPEQKAVADQHFGGWRMAQGGPRGYGYGRWR